MESGLFGKADHDPDSQKEVEDRGDIDPASEGQKEGVNGFGEQDVELALVDEVREVPEVPLEEGGEDGVAGKEDPQKEKHLRLRPTRQGRSVGIDDGEQRVFDAQPDEINHNHREKVGAIDGLANQVVLELYSKNSTISK